MGLLYNNQEKRKFFAPHYQAASDGKRWRFECLHCSEKVILASNRGEDHSAAREKIYRHLVDAHQIATFDGRWFRT